VPMDTQTADLHTKPGLLGLAVDLRARDRERAMEMARLADEYRADFVSVPDQPYDPGELETWTMLTTLAAHTEHVAVASNVMSLQRRPPAMLAKAAATLQVISGGRTILGLGAGEPNDPRTSFGGPQLSVGEAIDALEEGLGLIRRLWDPAATGPQSHDGEYYQLPEVEFGPVPQPPVPIWVGAFGPRMLGLTGRLADGWLPTNYFLDLADVPGMQRRIDTAAGQAGREPRQVRRVFNVMGEISDTASLENGRTLVGPSGFWAEALRDYHERLGFDSFTFWPVSGERSSQVRRFFEEVRPQLGDRFQPAAARTVRPGGG
jgi:alkanesulfonate monooxygenase SsuD/methylene tetrahydromethanopterin reductase-like flavin-dependent oxidoreductase (luciferase family)